ncbi:MAG: SEC-C metal-binding domain-containing protein [Planctomycetota bacterium]|nr:SEC-C metal-binding domain-containing protein [Planctomycetota bacterium]
MTPPAFNIPPLGGILPGKRSNAKTKRVGRNDPCPCGSGKKYKKCCMRKQQD